MFSDLKNICSSIKHLSIACFNTRVVCNLIFLLLLDSFAVSADYLFFSLAFPVTHKLVT